jgi:hypothetical protein
VAALCSEAIAAAGTAGGAGAPTQAVRAEASGPLVAPTELAPTPPAPAATVRSSPGWRRGRPPIARPPARRRRASGRDDHPHAGAGCWRWSPASRSAVPSPSCWRRGEPAARRLVTGPDDPWSGEGPAKLVAVDAGLDDGQVVEPLPDDERDRLRDAMAASIRRHAPDIQGILAVAVAEMRHTRELAMVFPKVRAQPLLAGIIDSLIGTCELPFAERAS